MIAHHAAMARSLGDQLGLPEQVLVALGSAYEQWDGHGWPGELKGADVPLAARIAQLAEFTEVASRVGGMQAARDLARRRAGKQFDPALAKVVQTETQLILSGLDAVATWEAVITAEPALAVVLSGERFDTALGAIANFVDLKSPYMLGHARAVADLAAAAGDQLRLSEPELRALRRAGLVHDLGRLGVSNSIWDKPGPLGAGEWERVRLHPHITERMLHQSRALAPLGAITVQHCERLDGSGYPRGLAGAAIARPARILGAADAYQAMREVATVPPGARARRCRLRTARRGQSRAPRCRGCGGGSRCRRTSRPAPSRGPRRPHPRERSKC